MIESKQVVVSKPFDISKRIVFDAWLKVKDNGGAAGVDAGRSIDSQVREGFEIESVSGLESDVVGELLPSCGACC